MKTFLRVQRVTGVQVLTSDLQRAGAFYQDELKINSLLTAEVEEMAMYSFVKMQMPGDWEDTEENYERCKAVVYGDKHGTPDFMPHNDFTDILRVDGTVLMKYTVNDEGEIEDWFTVASNCAMYVLPHYYVIVDGRRVVADDVDEMAEKYEECEAAGKDVEAVIMDQEGGIDYRGSLEDMPDCYFRKSGYELGC